MAKRKRLSPAVLTPEIVSDGPSETKSMGRPPIATVAGEAADAAALVQVTQALTEAREEGRLIQKLPLAAIETGHLVRDRVSFDADEMAALQGSLAARGQQVPVEVVALAGGRYGLISGLRRVMALRALEAAEVLAIIRAPDTSAEAYLAMVEENEIRAGISFYERARLGAEAAKLGIYATPQAAIAALFASASPAKRSKIGSFVRIHDELGDVLRFAAAIPERLGLGLAGALEAAGFAKRLRKSLAAADPQDAAAERAVLEAALKPARVAKPESPEIVPGIRLAQAKGRITLEGPGVTEALRADLAAWLSTR